MVDPQWQLGSEYKLLTRNPAGAGGAVWVVRAHADGAERAVKILRPELTSVAEAVDDFRVLLDSVRQLDHPGILAAEGTVVHENRVAVVMRRVPGEDLSTLLNHRRLLTPAATALIVADLCDALAAAHAAGIVHGDVKPSNVLLEMGRESWVPRTVRLTDFGIAALAGAGGTAVLPAEYQAPENDVALERPTPASDVYAVGVILYEALAGRPPFTGSRPEHIARLHREASPPRIPALADQLWLLVTACLSKNPGQRPPAAQLADLLREIAPTIVPRPVLTTEATTRVEWTPVTAPAEPVMLIGAEPAAPAMPALGAMARLAKVGLHVGPRRSLVSGIRAMALAVFSGVVALAVVLALLRMAGNSPQNTVAVRSTPSQFLVLANPSATFASAESSSPTATKPTTSSPSPVTSPPAGGAAPSPTTIPSTPSAAASTTPATVAVSVAWQCTSHKVHPAGIRKTACIGIGSDNGLYIRGVFTVPAGQIISDIRVSLTDGSNIIATTSASCDGSSCSITGGPYDPPAGIYLAYAGIDDSAHNVVGPVIFYPGYYAASSN
jgi:serine/threonine-protein kinase